MNRLSKILLLGSAIALSLGNFSTVSAHSGYHKHRGYRHPRVVIVRPAPIYAYHPYRHHHRRYVRGPAAVYAYRPYHRYHRPVIIRRHSW